MIKNSKTFRKRLKVQPDRTSVAQEAIQMTWQIPIDIGER
jgi:hypothetical protein